MKNYENTAVALSEWEKTFRAEAGADNYSLFTLILKKLELPEDPTLMLEGTIVFVNMCVAYMEIDGRPYSEFLKQQTYDPKKSNDVLYQLTFDLHRRAYARVVLPLSLLPIDLADLYGALWNDFKAVGYCDFWISRIDETSLSQEEIANLEVAVHDDLRFDYCEDELSFWFDPDTHAGVLKVSVQDVYDDEDDDKDDDINLENDTKGE
jgi:hypothetical protein